MLRRQSPVVSPLNILTLAVGAMLAGAAGDADAMDCSRASTSAERTICGDKKLLLLDRDLTIVYHKFIKVFSDTGHYTHLVAETRTGQKEWLRKRNACGADAACIKVAYENRLAFLQSQVCHTRDDSPIYQKRAPAPKPAPPQTQPGETTSVCSPTDRVDYDFIKKSEGAMLDFYVPGAFKANVKTGKNLGPRYQKNRKTGDLQQKAMAASGVTVGEGVDLGQQTIDKLRRYMEIEEKKHGNPGSVDIENILSKVKPYIGLKKEKAVEALNDYYIKNDKSYPHLKKAEADFISSAVKHGYAEDAAALFNKKANPKMNFWALPSAAQTTLTDMRYHSYIPSVARHYYRADWEGAAAEFEALATGKYAQYQARFQARAQMLRDAITDRSLPKQGDPCAPKKTPVAFHRSVWWETQRRPRWA
ncbi:pesticin C-terminus-like muramidase [Acidithiobacillus ferrooxidans]|uniref:pesticin C-terminus-like muramidase n=1 Tax=Acidithiobacillus ferrooxidans TaxID=920 RepID=UPI000AD459CA|nr:pesticin C-terminus-like muramidase [Acidithiobacillus ferrooxidans]MCR2829664.1 pesticin C-terminus-like muramidase [Acidithiobacillus ferrooxidans]